MKGKFLGRTVTDSPLAIEKHKNRQRTQEIKGSLLTFSKISFEEFRDLQRPQNGLG